MANNIPVFEFGKDSYILKHKLDYNTTHGEYWSAITYGLLFTDYDLARKTQLENAENYDPIVISGDTSGITTIVMTYYDQEDIIGLYGLWSDTELVMSGITGPTIESGATFVNNRRYQEYYVPSGYTVLFNVGDYYNIYFDEILTETGTTIWEHFGPSGETWVATGTTESKIPWQITGITTENGYSTSAATWTVINYNPILKYKAMVIEVGSNYVRFERKLEDYIFNNLMKIASSTNYTTLCYTLESLSYCDRSYYGIKYIFEESKWNSYFTFTATSNDLTIQPIANKEDLYFDYDNVQFKVNYSGGTEEYYNFFTDGLYTKYKLDRFLDQLGYDPSTTIYFDHSAVTNTTYSGGTEFDIILLNSGDTEYYRPYTYIYASGNTEHICLILDISGDTLHVLTPRVNLLVGEVITEVNNMYTVEDISKMLYECYINIESI